jgi:predicted O-methyltransferase YrrM
MTSFRNVFACLVHESQECVIDLVRNLRYLDPDSVTLLYNGGRDPKLLNHGFPFEEYGAVVHPNPRPLAWGRLHDFALDCMQFAIENFPFDALTVVDSDQLAARRGYSKYLEQFVAANPNVGLAGNSCVVQPRTTRVGPVIAAYKELELWRPFLTRFSGGVEKFGHWSFWPSTVFTAAAAHELTRLFSKDEQLQDIMSRSQIWASEEVIFPMLVALLGFRVAENPCSYEYVKHRVAYSTREMDRALTRASVFWVHPVNRRYEDPLRAHIRRHFNHYENALRPGGIMATEPNEPAPVRPLLLTVPILNRMRGIEGWLEDDEADLLIAATTRAIDELPQPRLIVEVGSYCGRSTVVFGSVLKALGAEGRIYAIDPHDGVVGALDSGLRTGPSTLARFARNISDAGLNDVVVTVQQRSFDVSWEHPISLLFIDGLHDYANVARDFYHFELNVVTGGYIAFHDYADYYPGVKAFVNELLATPGYEQVHRASSMILLRKRAAGRAQEEHGQRDLAGAGAAGNGAGRAARAETVRETALASDGVPGPRGAPPSAPARSGGDGPLVTCLMPTFNRPLFVPQAIRCFLAQEYPHKELIIVDDGEQRIDLDLSGEASIRYVPLDRRLSLGEKRNLAATLSTGEILAHWDDDDWYGPRYLSQLVKKLRHDGEGSLTGLSRYLVYMLPTGSLKVCASKGPAGASFCYWKRIWERHRYRDTPRAEDYFFLEDARPRVRCLQDPELFAIVRHRNHTWTQEHGRDVNRRLNSLPAYKKPLGAVVGHDAAAFYEHARQVLFGARAAGGR